MKLGNKESILRSALAALLLGAGLMLAGAAHADADMPGMLPLFSGGDEDAIQYPGGLPILPMDPTPTGTRLNPSGPGVQILNNLGLGISALSFNQSTGFIPPDTQGAAGPFGYVETVNQAIGLYAPRTAAVPQVAALSTFFFTTGGLTKVDAGSGLSDPVVQYNAAIGRFIIVDQNVNFTTHLSSLVFAVSKTNNPTTLTAADWNFFKVSTTEANFDADYPGNFGWNADATVITLNMFPVSGGSGHVLVVSVSNASLVANSPVAFKSDVADFSLRPAVIHDGVAGGPMWLVTEHSLTSIDVIRMDNVLSNTPTYTYTNLPIAAYTAVALPRNPNGTVITNNIDSRIQCAGAWGGSLVAAHSVAASTTQDVIRWYQFDVSTGTPTLSQQGNVSAGANTYLTYPGIDINSVGQIGMSFMRSGTDTPTDYMSMYVTGRYPSDPAGTMNPPVLVPAGAGQANYHDFSTGRAGDLSGINVDPADLTSFWAVNEFANTQATANWGTAIANFKMPDLVTATLLQRFDATRTEAGIEVRWQFGSRTDVTSAIVERATNEQGPWFDVAGTPQLVDGYMSLIDVDAPNDAQPMYRLVTTSKDGSTSTFGPVLATGSNPMLGFSLTTVGANPGHGSARIAYSVPRQTHVNISAYDLQGREVATLVDGSVSSGRYETDLKAPQGKSLQTGIFFVRMTWAGGSRTQRVVLVP